MLFLGEHYPNYQSWDIDKDGKVSPEEFSRAWGVGQAGVEGKAAWLSSMLLNHLEEAGTDKGGLCSYEDLESTGLGGVWGEAEKSLPLSRKVLGAADLDRDNLLSAAELARLVTFAAPLLLPQGTHLEHHMHLPDAELWYKARRDCVGSFALVIGAVGKAAWMRASLLGPLEAADRNEDGLASIQELLQAARGEGFEPL